MPGKKRIQIYHPNGVPFTKQPLFFSRLDVLDNYTILFKDDDVIINLPFALKTVTFTGETDKPTVIINWINESYAIIDYA